MKDGFGLYKEAIRKKYELERQGDFANYLHTPTDAKLRRLCQARLQDNTSENDNAIFERFFGFRIQGNGQKLVKQTDDFKTIKKFLKGQSVLTDENAADLLALMLDFQPRPFVKFLRASSFGKSSAGSSSFEHIEDEIAQNRSSVRIAADESDTRVNQFDTEPQATAEAVQQFKSLSDGAKKWLAYGLLFVSAAFLVNFFTSRPDCMVWANDHYERVDCGHQRAVVPFRERLLEFRKIKVSDTTAFFRQGRPAVWYSKQKNVYEFFNAGGTHPVTGAELRPITVYLIHRRVWERDGRQ